MNEIYVEPGRLDGLAAKRKELDEKSKP